MLSRLISILGTFIFVVVFGTIISGCDDNQTSQRFTVTYEVSGTFIDCTVFYITRRDDVDPDEVNKGGQSLQEDVALPWSLTYDVTVTPMFPFNTQIAAVCSDSDGGEVEVSLSVDDEVKDTDQASGRNVSALAEYRLEVN